MATSSGAAAPTPQLLPHTMLHQSYIDKHRLGDIVEHLSYALLVHKPSDHASFTRQWLANLSAKMTSLGQSTCDGINLFSIDGTKAQTFTASASTSPRRSSRLLGETRHHGDKHQPQRKTSTTTIVEPPVPSAGVVSAEASIDPQVSGVAIPEHPGVAAGERSADKFKRVAHGAAKKRNTAHASSLAVEQISKLAEKLHKDDVQTAMSFLQNLLTRRTEKQRKEAEETRMLRKYKQQHALAAERGATQQKGGAPNGGPDTPENASAGLRADNDVASTSIDQPRRRIAISATPMNVDDAPSFHITDVEKSAEERKKLLDCVQQCSLFTAFDDVQKELVVRAMTKEEFAAGFDILSQGQPGKETFFLVASGMAEVIKDKRVVAPIHSGQYFGELELMYNEASCAATIRTITAVTTYGLGKETYQHIVLNAALERRATFLKLIEIVGIFETLIDYDKMRVAEALMIQPCTEGDVLIRCGEPVLWMYVVMEGTTRVVGRDPEGKPVNVIDLGAGQVVGELEFVFHHSAVADVVVLSTHCKVAKLNRKHFEMIVGSDVTDQMKQYIASKDIYRHYMAHAQEDVKKEIVGAQKRTARRKGANTGASSKHLGSMHSHAALTNLLPAGEIFFDHSSHPCRFPLEAVTGGASKVMIIAVLEDGTIQRWNEPVARATQYRSDQALGQSIFSFLTSELEQSKFHRMLRAAREWTGNWEGFVEAGLHKSHPFGFTQAESLAKVILSLTVVPSVFSSSSSGDVFLAVGTEIKVKPPSSAALDLGNWLRDKMKPRLTAISRMLQDGSELSVGALRKVRGGVQLCERTLEQFVRIASTNIDSLQEGWRPVSMRIFTQRFLSVVSANVLKNGNHIVVEIAEDFPMNDVFLDSDGMIKALEVAVEDANTCGLAGLDIVVRVEAVSHDSGGGGDTLASVNSMANFSKSMALETSPTLFSGDVMIVRVEAVSHDSGGGGDTLASVNSMANFSKSMALETSPTLFSGDVNATTQPNSPFASGGISSSSSSAITNNGPKLIRIAIEDYKDSNASSSKGVTPSHGANNNGCDTSFINQSDTDLPSLILPSRGAHVSDIRHCLTSMNGMVTFLPPRGGAIGALYTIEVPLVVGEGGGDISAAEGAGSTHLQQHTFTTVLVERSAVHRNNVCQVLWARRHAVLPVATWSEVTKLVASGTCDILVIDPESLSDPIFTTTNEDPFDMIRSLGQRLAIIVTSEEGGTFSNRRLEASTNTSNPSLLEEEEEADTNAASLQQQQQVLQLPKPWHMKTLIDTFSTAERLVVQRREDESRIAALRNTFNETKRGNCEVVRLLGRGAFGEVHEVVDELTGGRMAMKAMRLKREADVDALVEEIRTMTNLQHENIIHYFFCEKTSNSELKIFMELANGTLQDKIMATPGGCGLAHFEIVRHLKDLLQGLAYIHKHGYIHCDIKTANALLDSKDRTNKIMATPGGCGLAHFEIVRHLKDLLQGLAYIHKHGYIHCDIKTANALLDSKDRTKLGDFGAAKKLKPGEKILVMCGTPMYMAPEVMAADADENLGYDFKADIWSLGCVVMEMVTGQPPFAHIDAAQGMGIFKYVSELTSTPDLSPLFHAGPLLTAFVKACLDPNRSCAGPRLLEEFKGKNWVLHRLTTQQAEKLVKRAQLLHVLSKYIAFQDEDGNPPPKWKGGSIGHSHEGSPLDTENSMGGDFRSGTDNGSSYFDSFDEGDDFDGASSAADSKIIQLRTNGGDFFSSDDEDDEDDDEGTNSASDAG
ncbi:protein kinase, putative [Bodo saltans]|uniref:Protein kinase, putative n=1 Tax=Bodo saltans TaxID=75058 RepID=A0A0S4J2G9_BODSA|nr:protein kinase, putative [Bodo saltans]|eukprot:CUG68058.1 protein kinase, putative [Bodo saltans]